MRPYTNIRIMRVRLGIAILVLYWVAIFTGTHLPSVPTELMKYNDKVIHFVAYFGLGFLLCYVSYGKTLWRRFAFVAIIGAVYAVIDELTQSLVPGRSTDPEDFLADMGGIFTAIALYLAIRQTRRFLRTRSRTANAA